MVVGELEELGVKQNSTFFFLLCLAIRKGSKIEENNYLINILLLFYYLEQLSG